MKHKIIIYSLKGFIVAALCVLIRAATAYGDGLNATDIKGVILSGPTNPVMNRCVSTLISGLKTRYGVEISVIPDEEKPAAGIIYIGKKAALKSGLVAASELKAVEPGGHVVKCDGENIAIAGADAWKTLYGISAFFDWIDGKYFGNNPANGKHPAKGSRNMPVFSFADKPAFEYRCGVLAALRQTSGEWADCRLGLNPELFDPKKTGSDLWIDHTAGYLVPKLLYYDKHPEYYAMKEDGKRFGKNEFSDHRTPLCLSNKDAGKIAAERAVAWVDMNLHMTYFPITHGDGAWCQCEKCKALDHAERKYARRLLLWANPIAEAISKKHPDKWCFTFAYGGSDEPPPDVKPVNNLLIVGSIGLGNVLFFDHWAREGMIAEKAKKIEDWKAIVPDRFMVCEYVSGAYQPAMAANLAARLRYYRDNGLFGILTTYGLPIAFRPVWNELIGRLMWNPDLDPQKIAEAAITSNYGPGAEPIKEFFRLIQARYTETLKEKGALVDGYPAGFYSLELVEKALACFAKARENITKALESVESATDKRALTALRDSVTGNEQAFIFDVMQHPTSNKLDDAMKKILRVQLDLLFARSGDDEQSRIAFARETHKVGVAVNAKLAGAQEFFEDWIKKNNLPMPKGEKIEGGVHLPPEVFMYAGFGPRKYGEFSCPPRVAVAVYVKGNSMNRSHRMAAQFELDDIPGDGSAVLDIFGQDSDHPKPPANIRILINGKTIYEGQVSVVKKNWSGQAFEIPPGILVKGHNELEIQNITDINAIEKWYERWFMVCDAKILFKEK
ncbi:MAG: DUF4838 domain-containing protein [Lentisphaerae bacterium]|nr:DUF4838 domain-containing protein [Lentisphaerota bacterium]